MCCFIYDFPVIVLNAWNADYEVYSILEMTFIFAVGDNFNMTSTVLNHENVQLLLQHFYGILVPFSLWWRIIGAVLSAVVELLCISCYFLSPCLIITAMIPVLVILHYQRYFLRELTFVVGFIKAIAMASTAVIYIYTYSIYF